MNNITKLTLPVVLAVVLAGLLVLPGCSLGADVPPAPMEATEDVTAETSVDTSTEEPAVITTEAPAATSTEAPAETPTEVPTEAPVLNRDPLTGAPLEAPATGRIFAFPINNEEASLPHVGTQDAGIIFEMYVNGYFTRCLALYTDITKVEAIGPIRSVRQNITDICAAFDAFLGHANGSEEVMQDLEESGVDNIWVSTSEKMAYWDIPRRKKGYSLDSRLFVKGPDVHQYLVEKGMRVLATEENKSYGLNFAEDGTPTGGEDAGKIDINFRIQNTSKLTTMTYDAQLGRYVYTQYGRDGKKDDPENFENVFVMFAEVSTTGVYHVANLDGSGDGYYACNGKIVPVQWHHQNAADPITFTRIDGTPLVQGIGNSYIAIVPLESTVEWK